MLQILLNYAKRKPHLYYKKKFPIFVATQKTTNFVETNQCKYGVGFCQVFDVKSYAWLRSTFWTVFVGIALQAPQHTTLPPQTLMSWNALSHLTLAHYVGCVTLASTTLLAGTLPNIISKDLIIP